MCDFTEIIYDATEATKLILEKFPDAIIEDATDAIHDERFSVTLNNNQKNNFYILALKEGFALNCLCFQLMLMDSKANNGEKIKEWMKKAGLKLPDKIKK